MHGPRSHLGSTARTPRRHFFRRGGRLHDVGGGKPISTGTARAQETKQKGWVKTKTPLGTTRRLSLEFRHGTHWPRYFHHSFARVVGSRGFHSASHVRGSIATTDRARFVGTRVYHGEGGVSGAGCGGGGGGGGR